MRTVGLPLNSVSGTTLPAVSFSGGTSASSVCTESALAAAARRSRQETLAIVAVRVGRGIGTNGASAARCKVPSNAVVRLLPAIERFRWPYDSAGRLQSGIPVWRISFVVALLV